MKRHILALLSSIILSAASLMAASLPYTIKYTAENGLSNRTANCVTQDKTGYIWVGTDNGIDRFDGHRFKHIEVGEDLENSVHSLFADESGLLWVGTDKGLATYDLKSGKIERFSMETKWHVGIYSRVNVIVSAPEGKIIVGTDGQGLFIYDSKGKTLTQFSQHASMISAVADRGNGHMLIGSEEGTITEYDIAKGYIRTICSDSGNTEPRWSDVNAMTVIGNDVWAGMGHKGFCRISLDANAAAEYFKPEGIQGNFIVNCQAVKSPGILYVGGRYGIYGFSTETKKFSPIIENAISGISEDMQVSSIFQDKSGGLWMTIPDNGILYMPSENSGFSSSMNDWNVTAMCTDSKGDIWIGTQSGNLFHADRNGENPVKVNVNLPDIRCMMADLPSICIGTLSDGIYIYNTLTGAVVNKRYDRYNQSTIGDNCVNSLFKDSNGRIYVGTAWGLCYYNKKADKFVFEPRGSNKSSITGFFEDSRGNVWITTSNDGVYRENLKGRNWAQFTTNSNPMMNSNNVTSIMEDINGRIWLGTTDGICTYSYDTDKFTRMFASNPELSSKDIMSIEKDDNGKFWISSLSEIICVDPKSPEEKSIKGIYDSGDGIHCKLFSQNCSMVLSDGSLLFGGSKGIDRFHPDEVSSIAAVRRINESETVYITDITVDGRSVVASNPLKLKHNAENISIMFSNLDYPHSENMHYSCRLDGAEWSETGASVSYSKLPSGKHKFQVKTLVPGEDSESVAKLEIKVRPPVYATWWAFLTYVLAITGGFLLFRDRSRKRREEQSYKEKYGFFTNITHEIRTPLTLIKAPLEKIIASGDGTKQTRDYLKIIDKSTNNLLDLINQLLDYRKNEDGHYVISRKPCNVALITEDICSRFKAMAESEGKQIELSLPEESYTYEVDQDALGKIIHNLLSNAVKYAEKLIGVKMDAEQDHFCITVTNDGARIAQSEYENIFKMFYQVSGSKAGTGIGLPLAKMLAERHGGNITVSSEAMTTFTVTIPGERALIETPSVIESQDAEAKETVEEEEGAKPVILLVDDNVDLRLMVVEMLRSKYDVLQAGDGKEAMDVLEGNAVDLILCDVMMPNMDGYQFCEYVKSDMRWSNIPFIHITAKTALEDKIKGLKYGADDYIEKPFSMELLLTKVKTMLDNRKRVMEFYRGLPIVHPTQVSKITKSSADFIVKLKEELEKHLADENYNMVNMAESMFMSQSSFYRKVKALTGVSPNEFVKDFRLQRAAEMLSKGEYMVNEVFQKVGFNSVSYFSLCFKKKYGVSPAKYVESLKKDSTDAEAGK